MASATISDGFPRTACLAAVDAGNLNRLAFVNFLQCDIKFKPICLIHGSNSLESAILRVGSHHLAAAHP